MPSLKVNDGGTWKAATPWVNDAGTWKKPVAVWANDAGTWKQVWVGITYSPDDGSYSGGSTQFAPQSMSISCSQPVVWTWTKSGSGTVSVVNGGTASSLTFTVNKLNAGTLTVSSGGHNWTLDIGNGQAI